MGTVSDKLTYLNTTKGKIKDSINLTGAGITDQDTFRSYETKLKDGFVDIINNGVDTLYSNFPKVAQTGEEPTLNGIYEAPMRVDLNGNTEQTTYTGKISIKGKANTTAGIGVSNSSDLNIPSGEYTLSINKTLPFLINYVVTDTQNTNRAFRIPAGSTNVTVNLPYDCTKTGLFVAVENNVDYDLEFYLQLESGSTPTSFEPFVGGIPSPSPSYPQPIRVVKGNNTIKVTGKNLLNVSNSYSVTTSQEVNINLETGTYSMSCTDITTDVTTGTSSLCNFYHSDNTFDQLYFSHTNKVGQITITAPVTKVKIYSSNSFNNSNGKTTTFTNLMIEKGSTNTSYQPYQEQTYPLNLGTTELCKIGDYKDVIRKSTGKNLCNGVTQEVYLNTSVNTCGVASGNTGLYIPVNGGNYTISTTKTQERYRVACVNNEPSATAQTAYNGQNKDNTSDTITIDTTGYSYLIVNATDLTKIQIEKNNQATDYEPFGKVWYLKKNIGKVVLDGSEDWYAMWNETGRYAYRTDITNILQTTSQDVVASLFSNLFNTYSQIVLYQDSGDNFVDYGIGQRTNQSQIIIKNNDYTNVNDFKTWLSTHNTEVYYVLATPTYTQITDTDLINQLEDLKTAKSVEGQTNITQTNEELPFILDVSGLKKD